MAIGAIGSALLGIGSNALQGAAQGAYDHNQWIKRNKYNEGQAQVQREWQERMYGRQRTDQEKWALAQWHRENKYNSPIEQMARLKAAGINPNMAYMKGTLNNVTSGAQQVSADPGPGTKAEGENTLRGLQAFDMLGSIQRGATTNLTQQQADLAAQEKQNKATIDIINNIKGRMLRSDEKFHEMNVMAGLENTIQKNINMQTEVSKLQSDIALNDQKAWDLWSTRGGRLAVLESEVSKNLASATYQGILGDIANKKAPTEIRLMKKQISRLTHQNVTDVQAWKLMGIKQALGQVELKYAKKGVNWNKDDLATRLIAGDADVSPLLGTKAGLDAGSNIAGKLLGGIGIAKLSKLLSGGKKSTIGF